MINYSNITKAIEAILAGNTSGYTISRNDHRMSNPSTVARNKGWIGIYRGPVKYLPYAIGGNVWMCEAKPIIEIQVVSMKSGEEAEDKLQTAEKEILDLLAANKQLNGTVLMTTGYDIQYEYNADSDKVWYHSAIISLTAEVRA